MKNTNTTSSIITMRSYFGVGLIMTGVLAGGCLSGEGLNPSEEVGSIESALGDGEPVYSYGDETGGEGAADSGGEPDGEEETNDPNVEEPDGEEDTNDPDVEEPDDDDTTCEEPPHECEVEGAVDEFCGDEYVCAAAPAENDPTWRECVDQCLADGVEAIRACNEDFERDNAWCDSVYPIHNNPSPWIVQANDVCRYGATQTRNLCYVAAAGEQIACQSQCTPLITKLWQLLK